MPQILSPAILSATRHEELLNWDLHYTYRKPVCTAAIKPKWKTMTIVVNDECGWSSDLGVVEECKEGDEGGDNESASFRVFVCGALNLQVSQSASVSGEEQGMGAGSPGLEEGQVIHSLEKGVRIPGKRGQAQ
jgi:hypothetical protein